MTLIGLLLVLAGGFVSARSRLTRAETQNSLRTLLHRSDRARGTITPARLSFPLVSRSRVRG